MQHLSGTGAYLGQVASPGSGDTHLQQGWDVEVFGNDVFVALPKVRDFWEAF